MNPDGVAPSPTPTAGAVTQSPYSLDIGLFCLVGPVWQCRHLARKFVCTAAMNVKLTIRAKSGSQALLWQIVSASLTASCCSAIAPMIAYVLLCTSSFQRAVSNSRKATVSVVAA